MAMKWERPETITTFPIIDTFPLRRAQREFCAKVMEYGDILDVSIVQEDLAEKRKHRWKYLKNFFIIVNKPPYDKCSFENALYRHATFFTSIEQYVMQVVLEFKFSAKMKMDDHLRWMFLSFDSYRQNNVDWREILLYYKVLRYFRMIRDSPLDIILLLFDVYGEGGEEDERGKVDRDRIVLTNARTVLLTIFQVPCITEGELYGMETMLEGLFDYLENTGDKISRRDVENGFRNGRFSERAVNYWASLAWDRLLPDQRLTVLDEAQTKHALAADVIIARFQLQQALVIYAKNTVKHIFRAWKIVTIKASGARAFAQTRLQMRALRMLCRWQRISRRYAIYRRKRILAQVMGDYAVKTRCFRRILLHNTIIRRITRVSGSLIPHAKKLILAASHLRECRRLYEQRVGLCRWRAVCRMWKNHEIATAHYRRHLLRSTFLPWFTIAHAAAVEERQEAVVRENQLALQRMLEEAEAATKEMLWIEQQREEKRLKQEKEEQERQQQERLEKAKLQVAQEKEREKRALLREQADKRTLRIKQEMARLKIVFNMEFEFKAQEAMEHTKDRTISYIENPENKLSIDLKFEQLKREFHANPTPETREREKMLSSYKNILFLFIDAQLKRERIELNDLFARYDVGKKGYLTYGEFATMIRSLNTKLNEAQISNVIRHVDADRDGYITLSECQSCMLCVHKMGAPGSSWKLYIDPAEDVICYHNFETNEKFLEYEITDKVLRGITISNIYAEAEFNMQEELKVMRKEEWHIVLRSYMARRLQYMYRVWKGRQLRKRLIWRVLQREQAIKTRKQRLCAEFITRHWRGKKARRLFARQLAFTLEKVWDRESNRLFYYNHVTKESTWDKPRLLCMTGARAVAAKEEAADETAVDLTVSTNTAMNTTSSTNNNTVTTTSKSNNKSKRSSKRSGKAAAAASGASVKRQRKPTDPLDLGAFYSSVLTEPCVWVPLEIDTDAMAAATTKDSNIGSEDTNININTADDSSSSFSNIGTISYYHINAKRTFPGKPDGFPLCCVCNYQLAVHSCKDCYGDTATATSNNGDAGKRRLAHYCFTCHRNTHSNPFGFHQHAKAKRSQYNNPDFVSQLYNFQHEWEVTVPVRCEMCEGREKLFAAFQCQGCNDKAMCRKCFGRIHHASMKLTHSYFRI